MSAPLPFPGPQTANAIADRLERIASEIRAATAELHAANDEADREVRYRFEWCDDVPREVSLGLIETGLSSWYSSQPAARAAILALQRGETWTDTDIDPDTGKPCCVVTRIQ